MPLPSKGKSILMTPDPYHTPGYQGFCPQFKYQIGETFGRTTCNLLQSPGVASSGKLVLADIRTIRPGSQTQIDSKKKLLQRRTQSWGDQKLVEKMVPGYTGFIPKSQHFFGNRYAVNCRNAIADFEYDQQEHTEKLKELKLTAELQSGKSIPTTSPNQKLPLIRSRYITPLQQIAKEPSPYISRHSAPHALSPYYLANNDPRKNFMSGYTGFVPRSRGQLGMGYPIITNLALNEFTDDLMRSKGNMAKSVKVDRSATQLKDGKPIYPIETGLVPHYTGHIPGQKFRYGKTFGHSTENALKYDLTASI